MYTIKFLQILPNHWQEPVIQSLKRMGENGKLPNIIRCEINETLTSFNKFQLEMICDEYQLLQLGVYIGTELSKPNPLITIKEAEEKGIIQST